MTIDNPLLLQNPIEKVNKIAPDDVVPAIIRVIDDNLRGIDELVKQSMFSWNSLMLPLEKLENRMNKTWSPVSHLNSVCNTPELRKAYDEALGHLTTYSTKVGQNKALYQATKALYDARDEQGLSATQIHILKHSLIDFKLSGLHLEKEKQQTFAKIQGRLAELTSKFEQNILDATMSWSKAVTNKEALAGLPETELAMLAANAEAKGKKGFLVTLEIPSYLAVLTYADDRLLREEVYRAYTTRASELGPDKGKYDNGDIMAELLSLKNAKAKLLGYQNYAELSVETKMAESPSQVLAFLEKLNVASREQAIQEYEALKAFALSLGQPEIQAWDVAYFSEKLKQKNFQISESELRPYFPVNRVIDGLFEITEHHFNVSFKQTSDVAAWHQDVKHFELTRDNKVVAEFYLDLYARGHKRGGAWMDVCQSRFQLSNTEVQIPIAYLTCNFTPPVKNQPALLTHDEVVTLFHEFGHGIHHMLTQVNELSASGIANVPWDAVELPSQFMENFCYQAEVIAKLSKHYETGEALPQDKLDKLIAAKNFQSAMVMLRQLEFGIFDLKMHLSEPLSTQGIQAILDETRQKVAVVMPPEFNRFQNGFSHIFAGGYSAGYYSYKWAEVLSADAFSLFEDEGVLNPEAGKRFLKYILEKGGSAEPMELFTAFRGRKPEVEPLLKHSGIQ